MICTNCFEHDMVEATTHIECVGEVACMQCPDCEYVIFTHEQSLEIDRLRRERDKKVKELLSAPV